jgi:hypothetical protein
MMLHTVAFSLSTSGGRPKGGACLTLAILRPEGAALKGLQNSAQGFNPGTNHPERRALKGRQIERTNNAEIGFGNSSSVSAKPQSGLTQPIRQQHRLIERTLRQDAPYGWP